MALSATRQLDREAELSKTGGQSLTMVALDLNGRVLHGPAGAAKALEGRGQRVTLGLPAEDSRYHGHHLSVPAAT